MDQRIVVIDFETTGLSARAGDRAIEVAAVEVIDGQVGRHFASLSNPGVPVPSFITGLTGITSAMVRSAPDSRAVMHGLAQFVEDAPLVAHNAAFDAGFYGREMQLQGIDRENPFLCSLRVARRLYPRAQNHKLSTLADYVDIPMQGTYHRALADADLTARIFMTMCRDMRARYGIRSLSVELLERLQRVRVASADAWLTRVGHEQTVESPLCVRNVNLTNF